MCDKIGNYLSPGIMEYGPELNNFLFEAAMDRLLVIALDRYGAIWSKVPVEVFGKLKSHLVPKGVSLSPFQCSGSW